MEVDKRDEKNIGKVSDVLNEAEAERAYIASMNAATNDDYRRVFNSTNSKTKY